MLMIILICAAFGYWVWCRRNCNRDEPPAFPGSLPLIGHLHFFCGDSVQLWNFLKDISYECLKLGGVLSLFPGPKTIYVITDPEDILTVANSCLERDNYYKFGKGWMGDSLLTGAVPIWKEHRKLLSPAFSKVVIDDFLVAFNKQARRLVTKLEKEVGQDPFDHSVYTRLIALETICLTALGIDFTDETMLNKQYVNAAEQMYSIVLQRFKKIWLHKYFFYSLSSLKKKEDECLKIIHRVSDTVLKKRKADYLNNNNNNQKHLENKRGLKFKPFLDLLLELAIDKGAFNDREIRNHVDTMIVGGHDTSASVLMYSMVLVGSYPHVQERIFQELDDVFGDDDRDVTKHDLLKLSYLEAVLKETMRFQPIIPIVARKLDKNVKLRNCTLTKGRTCILFLYGAHRHPMWGPDVEEFKPERWLDPATLPDCPTAFAAFSVGRRNCIAKSYAYMSMKTTLAHLFRHYRVKGDHTKLQIKFDVMLKPVSGHYITIERRNNINNPNTQITNKI